MWGVDSMEGKASAALSIIIIILGIVMTSSRSSSSMTSRSSSSSSGLIGVGWQNRGRLGPVIGYSEPPCEKNDVDKVKQRDWDWHCYQRDKITMT